MAKLVAQNHPALYQIAEEVPPEEISHKHVQKVITDLQKVLRTCPQGVAIAAPQIGVPLRIFVVHDNTADGPRVPDLVAVNPRITKRAKKHTIMEEGCLSIPGYYGTVRRARNVTITAYDQTGTPFTRGAGGLLAQIFQHEIDHLDGILYTNHALELWRTNDDFTSRDT